MKVADYDIECRLTKEGKCFRPVGGRCYSIASDFQQLRERPASNWTVINEQYARSRCHVSGAYTILHPSFNRTANDCL